jgi:hypothetical protein
VVVGAAAEAWFSLDLKGWASEIDVLLFPRRRREAVGVVLDLENDLGVLDE